MTKTFNNTNFTLTTSESDIYVASSKTMTLLIQAINSTASNVTCEIWLTDASNVHKACLMPSQAISSYNGISDTNKHVIPSTYKIRGVANVDSAVYVEVSTLEGL